MSLALRFVDDHCNIREDFMGFLHCRWGLSGADLSKLLLNKLIEIGLNIQDCRGQGYDGAGAVSGYINVKVVNITAKRDQSIDGHLSDMEA